MNDAMRTWDAESGEAVSEPWRVLKKWVSCVTTSQSGLRLVTGSWDKTVRMWDLKKGERIGSPKNLKNTFCELDLL